MEAVNFTKHDYDLFNPQNIHFTSSKHFDEGVKGKIFK